MPTCQLHERSIYRFVGKRQQELPNPTIYLAIICNFSSILWRKAVDVHTPGFGSAVSLLRTCAVETFGYSRAAAHSPWRNGKWRRVLQRPFPWWLAPLVRSRSSTRVLAITLETSSSFTGRLCYKKLCRVRIWCLFLRPIWRTTTSKASVDSILWWLLHLRGLTAACPATNAGGVR